MVVTLADILAIEKEAIGMVVILADILAVEKEAAGMVVILADILAVFIRGNYYWTDVLFVIMVYEYSDGFFVMVMGSFHAIISPSLYECHQD